MSGKVARWQVGVVLALFMAWPAVSAALPQHGADPAHAEPAQRSTESRPGEATVLVPTDAEAPVSQPLTLILASVAVMVWFGLRRID